MIQNFKKDQDIAEHIFIGSTTMIGVSVTIISLFKIMNVSNKTLVDEMVSIDTLFFIFSCFLSYLSLRNEKLKRIEIYADICFFIGLIILIFAGFLIVFSGY
ncbi:MAG TPA: hypothetical protein PLJ42_00295 [Chitinophagales bacterium]|jgi:TRAP-type uncharacterized transport system fused permease subunit|nr:hypothetical protein [Chitinophagales bacterium]MBP6153645.1 hypothetical protein [Chitinophagales bacterium]HQV77095.1 hypothetical protein [Chitinophagales bacterium]HQW77839.1 hypothetical protein [Chitinophagales bacterium]HRB18828.1 hypothetical protein [Chitinophagales bacterium]